MASYTEFFADASGGGASNMNGGGINGGGIPTAAAAYTSTNGNWSTVTNIFTPTDGSTPANSVNVGDFASVYIDGATTPVYLARVTAVAAGANGGITLSSTAKSGTAPTTSANTRSIKVGGVWLGPNGTKQHPFDLITTSLTNSAGDIPRVNFKTGTNYAVTAGITQSGSGPLVFQGYTTSAGDGGRAVIDGGTSGASYIVLILSGGNGTTLADFIVQHNGATGSQAGLSLQATLCFVRNVIVNNVVGDGFVVQSNTGNVLIECEAYACNTSNTASKAGFDVTIQATTLIRCYAHDNTGSNSIGFRVNARGISLIQCIADTNGSHGIAFTGGNLLMNVVNCDLYNNTGDGINIGTATELVYIENCNFIKNGGYGINASGAGGYGLIFNCGYGSGSQVNTSGTTHTLGGIAESGAVTYASGVTPWNAPVTGDFTITLAAANGAGRGAFTETDGTNTGTVGKPDIGAAQAAASAAGMLFHATLTGGCDG
jgi:hypothetical protein